MSVSPLAASVFAAISRVENVDPRYNNPGGLMDLAYYQQTGQFRLMQFPTPDAGESAGLDLTQRYIDRGYDLSTFFSKWAPSGHGKNDPVAYAATVSGSTGLPVDVPLNQIAGGGGSWYTGGTGGDTGGQDTTDAGAGVSSTPLALGLAAGLLVLLAVVRR